MTEKNPNQKPCTELGEVVLKEVLGDNFAQVQLIDHHLFACIASLTLSISALSVARGSRTAHEYESMRHLLSFDLEISPSGTGELIEEIASLSAKYHEISNLPPLEDPVQSTIPEQRQAMLTVKSLIDEVYSDVSSSRDLVLKSLKTYAGG